MFYVAIKQVSTMQLTYNLKQQELFATLEQQAAIIFKDDVDNKVGPRCQYPFQSIGNQCKKEILS